MAELENRVFVRRVLAIGLAAGALFSSSATLAEPLGPRKSYALAHTDPVFLGLEFAGSLGLAAGVWFGAPSPPGRCTWCGSDGFDESVRDALRASHPRTAASLSHAFSTAAAPALVLGAFMPGLFDCSGQFLENVTITLDATMLSFALTHGVKRLAARERPAVHHGVVDQTEYASNEKEWNQSFFSADTSLAFSLGASAATLSYLRGYRHAPWVLFAGAVIGVGAGSLRIAADMHWATDVLTGAVVGSAIGFSVPYFLHGRLAREHAVTLVPIVSQGQAGALASATF